LYDSEALIIIRVICDDESPYLPSFGTVGSLQW